MKAMMYTMMAVATCSPLFADISTGAPASVTPQIPTRVQGNCDLLASNTVRATFQGMRTMPVQTLDDETPGTMDVAVFQVLENLAYRRYVRYGDGRLAPGSRFTVAMSRELPGQPASVVDDIGQMTPGEEAVLKIDHLYLFGDQEGTPVRPCTRMARRQSVPAAPIAQPADEPASPKTEDPQQEVLPLVQPGGASASGSGSSYSRSISRTFSANGGNVKTESVEVISEKLPGSTEVKTRMFINGKEVDPVTRQPIATSGAIQQTATQTTQPAATAPAPAATTPAPVKTAPEGAVDDTVIEQPAATVPSGSPALSDEDSF